MFSNFYDGVGFLCNGRNQPRVLAFTLRRMTHFLLEIHVQGQVKTLSTAKRAATRDTRSIVSFTSDCVIWIVYSEYAVVLVLVRSLREMGLHRRFRHIEGINNYFRKRFYCQLYKLFVTFVGGYSFIGQPFVG